MPFKTTDLCDEHAEAIVLSPLLRDFGGRIDFEGPALTVTCREDNSRIKELSQTTGDGRVLVVDGGGSQRCALIGDVIGADLVRNGWAGAVVWGCIRDSEVLRTLDLGVRALAACPRRSQRRGEGHVGGPIAFDGQPVRSGDRIVADADGVIVLPAAEAAGGKA